MLRTAQQAGLSPNAFWQLSLKEWRWLCTKKADRIDRTRLTEMMEAYRDDRV